MNVIRFNIIRNVIDAPILNDMQVFYSIKHFYMDSI
jgi:hypothetical protein